MIHHLQTIVGSEAMNFTEEEFDSQLLGSASLVIYISLVIRVAAGHFPNFLKVNEVFH